MVEMTYRHVASESAKAPPTTGLSKVPSPQVISILARYAGRSWIVVVAAMRTMTPRYIPTLPRPLSARPTIRLFMFGAAPQRALPASKTATLAMLSHLGLRCEYSWPLKRLTAVATMMEATASHAISLMESNCNTI